MRILIVEDESRSAKRLSRLTTTLLGSEVEELWLARTLSEAKEQLAQHPIDLLLLDLSLSGRDGFELLQEALAESFHTIVVSAHTDQACRAFEYGVLDFVPKPVATERLETAFRRWRQGRGAGDPKLKYLAVKSHGRVQLIPLGEVLYIQGADVYSEIHLRDGGTRLHDKTLDRLEQLLSHEFIRVHRSYIVAIGDIHRFNSLGASRYTIDLKPGLTLPVGRSRVADLRARLFQ